MITIYTLLLGVVYSAWASNPVVKSPAGTFLGTELTARNGLVYSAFRGIPFAEPPVGNLRFRPPVAVSRLDGVYDATNFKPHCVQLNSMSSEFDMGQEDCLYLNIFTPQIDEDNDGDLKKIYVYFHGGGNTNGFTSVFIPGTLVTEHDIIVVTVAYRLGYLGLLSTMTPGCEGNFYLKDQLQSLLWLKENILDFGGDPNGITIGGQSAGAFDTSLLSLISSSRDLFVRAYSQSGTTGTRNTLLTTNPRPHAIKIGRELGCLGNNQDDPVTDQEFDDMADCLRQIPASMFSMNGTSIEIHYLRPVLYGDLFPKSIEDLFSDADYLKSIKFLDRDYLVGLDHNEGGFFDAIQERTLAALSEEVRNNLPPNFFFANTLQMFLSPIFGPVSQEVVGKIAEYYERNGVFGPVPDMSADSLFHITAYQYVTAAAAGRSAKDSRVYLFRFTHHLEWLLDKYQSMTHGLDLIYLFDLDVETVIKILPVKVDLSRWSEKDELMKRKFTSMVADFIKTGNPGRSLNSDLPFDWPGYDSKQQQYLELDLTPEINHHLLEDRIKLWSEQIPQWIKEFSVTKEKHEEL